MRLDSTKPIPARSDRAITGPLGTPARLGPPGTAPRPLDRPISAGGWRLAGPAYKLDCEESETCPKWPQSGVRCDKTVQRP